MTPGRQLDVDLHGARRRRARSARSGPSARTRRTARWRLHGDVRRTRRRAAAGRAPPRRRDGAAHAGTPSSDRDLEAGAELVEVRDAGDDLEPPVAGRGQRRAARSRSGRGRPFAAWNLTAAMPRSGSEASTRSSFGASYWRPSRAVEQVQVDLVRTRGGPGSTVSSARAGPSVGGRRVRPGRLRVGGRVAGQRAGRRRARRRRARPRRAARGAAARRPSRAACRRRPRARRPGKDAAAVHGAGAESTSTSTP